MWVTRMTVGIGPNRALVVNSPMPNSTRFPPVGEAVKTMQQTRKPFSGCCDLLSSALIRLPIYFADHRHSLCINSSGKPIKMSSARSSGVRCTCITSPYRTRFPRCRFCSATLSSFSASAARCKTIFIKGR